eukprot:s3159_g3.t1
MSRHGVEHGVAMAAVAARPPLGGGRVSGRLFLPVLAVLAVPVLGFQRLGRLGLSFSRGPRVSLRAAEGSGPSPEAWRDFRAQLIAREEMNNNLEHAALQSRDLWMYKLAFSAFRFASWGPAEATGREKRTVAPKNAQLLRSQSEELWNEYMNGAWAHVAPVEVGGLLCRSPLPAQITWLMRQNSSDFVWARRLRERILQELPEVSGRQPEELFETWSQNTMFCYKVADKLTETALMEIAASAKQRGIDMRSLDEAGRELVMLYGSMDRTWQSVCLVLRAASTSCAAEAVAINRPFARSVNNELAQFLLFGSRPAEGEEEQRLQYRFLEAFGDKAAVYVGGPEMQSGPGLLIHGFELEGSSELAPGTRIYQGGVEAAIDGILAGRYSPLDFRWFVGRHLDLRTDDFAWISMASARPLTLKQCLGLPKPLWHEVMELCGGEYSDLSRVELVQRADLDEDVRNGDEEDDSRNRAKQRKSPPEDTKAKDQELSEGRHLLQASEQGSDFALHSKVLSGLGALGERLHDELDLTFKDGLGFQIPETRQVEPYDWDSTNAVGDAELEAAVRTGEEVTISLEMLGTVRTQYGKAQTGGPPSVILPSGA